MPLDNGLDPRYAPVPAAPGVSAHVAVIVVGALVVALAALGVGLLVRRSGAS
jgi:hypothetical protein